MRDALSGDVVDMKAATEVICSRTSSQIQVFKQAYYAKFGVHLEQDIEFRASGDHRKVISLLYTCVFEYELATDIEFENPFVCPLRCMPVTKDKVALKVLGANQC